MRTKLSAALLVLATAMLACTVFVGGPSYPDAPAAAQPDAPDLQTQIQQAVADAAQTGTLKIDITESQLTAYLAAALAAQSDPVISDPEVVLRDGLLMLYGKARSGVFTATVKVTAQVTVDQVGAPQIEITQADFGPVAAPESLRMAAGELLRQTLTGPIGPAAIGFRLETINIADGTMTVTGRVQ